MKGKKVSEMKLIHEKCFGKDVAKVSFKSFANKGWRDKNEF